MNRKVAPRPAGPGRPTVDFSKVGVLRRPGGDVPRQPGEAVIGVGDVIQLIVADFQGEYQVYVAAAGERLATLRFALSLLAAPFAATVALVGAKVLPPAAVTVWPRVPTYLFCLLVAFGVLAILPYIRMIEAGVTHVRTARALNNFRLLYARELRDHLGIRDWSPNLPVDPHYPESFAPLSWSGINAMVLAGLVAAEITVGIVGLSRVRPAPTLIAFGTLTVGLLLFGLYFARTAIPARHGPGNPLGFPDVET